MNINSLLMTLLALSCRGVSGSGIFGFLFGSETEEEKLMRFVGDFNTYFRNTVGVNSAARSVPTREARDQGRRAFDCVKYIADFNTDRWLPEFPFLQGFVFERYYESFTNQASIDNLCNYKERLMVHREREARRLQEREAPNLHEMKSPANNNDDESHIKQRALATPVEAVYAATTSDNYANWARKRVGKFIDDQVDGAADLTTPTYIINVINDIFGPAEDLRTAVGAVFATKNSVDVVCRVAGIFEIIFDPGDFCGIISESLDFAGDMTQLALRVVEGDTTLTNVHDNFIDSSEIFATKENLEMLVCNM